MKKSSHLVQISGIYHYRIVTPEGEVRRSLRTRCPHEASRLCGLLDYHTPPMAKRQQAALRELYRLLLEEHTQALLEDRDSQVDVDDIPVEVSHLYTRIDDAAVADAEQSIISLARTGDAMTSPTPRTRLQLSPTLSEAFKEVESDKLATGTWTQKTANSATTKLTGFLDAAGDKPWASYTKSDVRKWRNSLSVKPTTANNQIAILASVFSWLIQQQDDPVANPFDGMRIKTTTTDREAFTKQEVRSILDCTTSWKHDAVLIAAHTGLRVAEMCQLDADDVVTVDGVRCVRLDHNKHKLKTASSARLVPLHPALDAVTFPLGKSATQVGNWFSRTGRAALGLPDHKVWHSLRMSFCLELMRAGVQEEQVAQLAGHSFGKSMSFKLYAAEGFQIKQLQEAVALLKY